MRTLRLHKKHEADHLEAEYLGEDSYDLLVQEDTRVLKPDGTLLLVYKRDAIGTLNARRAWRALRQVNFQTDNRGVAGGKLDEELMQFKEVAAQTRTRFRRKRIDGKDSKTQEANTVPSGVIGYYDRYPRIPYCRQTAFNARHAEKFTAALPFIHEVNQAFREHAPEGYARQQDIVNETSPDFVIAGTVFTTITVNKNWITAVHKDAGDYRDGFGVMSVLRAGQYDGCYLVFPEYRVAVDLQHQAVLMADVHCWHGNTAMRNAIPPYERISCIFYYREKMKKCGSAVQELERAKRL